MSMPVRRGFACKGKDLRHGDTRIAWICLNSFFEVDGSFAIFIVHVKLLAQEIIIIGRQTLFWSDCAGGWAGLAGGGGCAGVSYTCVEARELPDRWELCERWERWEL